MAEVVVEGVCKSFGAAIALNDLTLTAADGEILVLLGPSGCGKTTLLRVISGIVAHDAGRILIGGRRVDHLPPEERNLGLVFQSYALFPHLTVAGNVGFGLRVRRLPKAEIEARVGAALKLVDLENLAGRYTRQLSGGQQQRVALARAIAIQPQVLLLDEPLSNLDAKLREQLREELRALQRRLGVTSLYVTHDQVEAMALADRVIVMNQGRIVEGGAPIELYRRPKHRFTAEFLGQTNLVEAKAEGGFLTLPWGQSVSFDGAERGQVFLSIRPEEIAVADEGAPGVVNELTFLGGAVDYRVTVGPVALRVRMPAPAALLSVGDRVMIRLPRRLHVLQLDRDSPN
jgi:putative spermidine/putrescine transport system ATP-binding protein